MTNRKHDSSGPPIRPADGPEIEVAGGTDQGRVRTSNQDRYLIAELGKAMHVRDTNLPYGDRPALLENRVGKLLVVADGMGGHQAGAEASALAVGALNRYLLNTMPWFLGADHDDEEAAHEQLRFAVEQAAASVHRLSRAHPELSGMGTTLTAAYVLWPRLYVVHVGDSRCYLHRRGHLEQITTDHTVAHQLLEEGRRPELARRYSHVLWNVIGGGSKDVTVEAYRVELEPDDSLLLCSDGLTGHVDDHEIEAHLATPAPPAQVVSELTQLALERGGADNVTVVVARVLADPKGDRASRAAGADISDRETPELDQATVAAAASEES